MTAWEVLGVYRLLVQLLLANLPEDASRTGCASFLDADRDGTLVETLET